MQRLEKLPIALKCTLMFLGYGMMIGGILMGAGKEYSLPLFLFLVIVGVPLAASFTGVTFEAITSRFVGCK